MRSEGYDYNDNRHIANMLSESSAFTEQSDSFETQGRSHKRYMERSRLWLKKKRLFSCNLSKRANRSKSMLDRDLFRECIAGHKRFLALAPWGETNS